MIKYFLTYKTMAEIPGQHLDSVSSQPTISNEDALQKGNEQKNRIDIIRKQGQLAGKIENTNSYGLSDFYKMLPENQKTDFIANLVDAGIDPDDFNLIGARCTTFQIKDGGGKNQSFSIAFIKSGNKNISFPDIAQSCGPGGKDIPSLEEYLTIFNTTNNFPNLPLDSEVMKKLESDIIKTSAKDFLEKGDKKLFNLAFDQFSNLSDQVKQDILNKIKELYIKDYSELKDLSVNYMRTKIEGGQRLFIVGKDMGFFFGE